jgi:two-component system, sensor histidine kinase and response regulator
MCSLLTQADILIVDDAIESLRLLSAMLEEQGYEVRGVTNGSTALIGVQGLVPDLILLDIQMPGMNGYEVCQQLKDSSLTRDIPVIFLSASNEAFDKVKAFAVGGVDYITKPFQVEEVLARVAHHLNLRRLQAQLQQTQIELRHSLEQERSLNQKIEAMATREERHRIARDMHDSLGHSLGALNIHLETVLALWHEAPAKAYTFLVESKQLSVEALQAVRRSITQMRSESELDQGLEPAIATLLRGFYQTTGILPATEIDLTYSLPQVNTVVYRIIQEGLTNIAKHAEATFVTLQIQTHSAELLLMLQDNGKGFSTDASTNGFGLRGMRERTIAIGGQLEIASAPGAGCQITARFPRLGS